MEAPEKDVIRSVSSVLRLVTHHLRQRREALRVDATGPLVLTTLDEAADVVEGQANVLDELRGAL